MDKPAGDKSSGWLVYVILHLIHCPAAFQHYTKQNINWVSAAVIIQVLFLIHHRQQMSEIALMRTCKYFKGRKAYLCVICSISNAEKQQFWDLIKVETDLNNN